ncbi:MAG: 4-hydroxy-tetrahydrodipicolinate reductase, partial [Acidimicrobiales bacterium]|nr:4-hydroxy-tetrahydrodipicolinate reductase [Acidimicrobiales bacterium]
DPGTELVARIDLDDSLEQLTGQRADVVVDFTVLDVARETLHFAAANGIHAVVGTTGFSDEDLESFRAAFTSSNALIAPNFAIGAVLMIRMAELAAPHFETAEIIEFHHNAKVDAPSGTATHTAERMAAASGEWADDPTTHEVYPGARGGIGPAGIRVHGVRMVGAVANQEVILGTTGQTLTIRHDTVDRTSFMPGVLVGVKRVAEFPGVTIGLDTYLGL